MQRNVSLAIGTAAVVLTTAAAVPVIMAVGSSTGQEAAADPAGRRPAYALAGQQAANKAAGAPTASATPGRRAANAAVALAAARQAADTLVQAEPQRFHLSDADEVAENPDVVIQDDLQYVAYERTHKGLPVRGGDFVVVTDSTGAVRSSTVAQQRPLSVNVRPSITSGRAVAVAKRRLHRVDAVERVTLVVVARGGGRLAYEVVLAGVAADEHGRRPSRQHVFVDARSGRMMRDASYDEVQHVDGKGFYYGDVELDVGDTMVDTERRGLQCGGQDGRPTRVAGEPVGDGSGTDLTTACVDAMHAAARQWDMLREWLRRDGIDGKGGAFPIRVGLDQVNAFWNGRFTSFGHSSDDRRQLVAIDIVAHEFGHAIFQNTPGGSGGGNEAGGLNESTGDIFGALTEFFAKEAKDQPDYDVGELADLAGRGPIRVMSDPSKVGDPNCFSDRIPSTEVHAAAGPQNHWFYLLAEGSNPSNGQPRSPTCNNSEVTGIGIEKAGKIFMGALNRKTSGWTHAKARAASVAAAADLFPGGEECAAVKKAWDAVSVRAANGEPACGNGGPRPEPTQTAGPTAGPDAPAPTGGPQAPTPTGTAPGRDPAPGRPGAGGGPAGGGEATAPSSP